MDLSGKTDEEVFRLAANCIWEVMTRRRLADKAQHLLEKAAYPEIERRCRGPETGLLHAFGYHVGSTDPVPRDRRHAILRYVFRSRLPVVQDETHMAEWGQPLSDTRRERIASTLRWFLDTAQA
jgi:hypothetical protein